MPSTVKFFRGFAIPFNGFFTVITSFKLFILAIIPFWLALGISIYGLYHFWSQSSFLFPFLMKWLPGFYNFVESIKIGQFSLFAAIFQGLFWAFLLLFAIYFSYILLCILGAPFYSLMADDILNKKGVQPRLKNSLLRWLYTTLKMLIVSVIKLSLFVLITGFLFLVSFWSFAVMLVPLVVCLMIAYDCMDFSMECMCYSFRQRWRYMKEHFSLFLGLAFAVMFFSFVPGLFTLALPFFIAGCADVFADIQLQGHE